jgi:NADPH:quinone reductase
MATVVRFHEVGGPEVLRLEDIMVPDPGPDELKIKVEAIGLNRAELAFRSGRYLESPKFPSGLGYEAAGTIIAIGSAQREFVLGQRVGVIPAFSMTEYGTYGEEVLVPSSAAVSCPKEVSSASFAAVWMQYITAYGALVDIGAVKRGDYVVITAASSSVGLAAIQICLALGAVPVATTRTAAKREALLKAGARIVIVTQEQDLPAEVHKITGGSGARIVFDPVAGAYVEKLAEATASGGLMLIYGGLNPDATPFPRRIAMMRGLSMRGYTLFEITRDAARLANAKKFVLEGLAAGTLHPLIDRSFHLKDIADAHRYMEAGEQIGKIIVTVP